MKTLIDPLTEKKFEVKPGLIWKYPNRLLWLVTYDCPSGCSFCFRRELNANRQQKTEPAEVVKWVELHPEIEEVIFSGGEPLMDISLIYQSILSLGKLSQIKVLRIHTRQPITFPKAINWELLSRIPAMVKQPIYMAIHVNHPKELDRPGVTAGIEKLRWAGFILLSQSVFLRGINDEVEVLEKLMSRLVGLGVKPYYIFHCDAMKHTQKLVVPVEKEVEIMTELRRRVSGLGYPLHVIDTQTGAGKVPVPTKFWRAELTSYSDFSGVWSEVSA